MKNILLILPFVFFFYRSANGQTDSLTTARKVDSLIQMNRALVEQQKFDEALGILETAEKKAETAFGKESAAYATCIFNRGRTYYFTKETPKAEQYYLESLKIREKVVGKKHADYATNLNNLGLLYFDMGDSPKAELYLTEALQIKGEVLGKNNASYISSLNTLARLYDDMGRYAEAVPLLAEQEELTKNLHGEGHPRHIRALLDLALKYQEIGKFEASEQSYLEAIRLQKENPEKNPSDYIRGLSELGQLYDNLSQFEKAEPLYFEARDSAASVYGKEHEEYGRVLFGMGLLYHTVNPEKAEAFYLEAKDILGKTKGMESSHYINCLNNLGVIYGEKGDYAKSEMFHLEVKKIREKVLGKEHPHYAYSLGNLAYIYMNVGRYKEAEITFLAVKAIFEKTLGKESKESINLLHVLTDLYRRMGNYEQAEIFCKESLILTEKTIGKNYFHYAPTLYSLIELYERQKRYDEVEKMMKEAIDIQTADFSKVVSHYSEKELSEYITPYEHQKHLFSYATERLKNKDNPGLLPDFSYNDALFHKGFLLMAASRINHLTLSDSAASKKNDLLKSCRRELAAQYAQPIAGRDSALVAELEEKADMAEKDLAKTVAGYAQVIQQVNWREIQAGLKPEEAAIEFVHYRFTFPKETDSVLYAALLVKPGLKNPFFIPLFEEKQLNALFRSFGARKATYANALYSYSPSERGAIVVRTDSAAQTLYALVWQPLVKALEGVRTVYYAPSGLLHRLNIGAIPLSEDSILADRYRLVQLGSTRQLVVSEEQTPAPSNTTAALFGGIQYEMDSTAILQANAGFSVGEVAVRGEMVFSQSDSTLRGGSWNYLKRTGVEVDSLASMLQRAGIRSTVKKGYEATEETFKQMGKNEPSPRILHVATHGFFFPDPASSDPAKGGEPAFKVSDNPMIRSGLILTGANYAWKTGRPLANLEDGILTAYEISQIDLRHTDLVVLSACETGLGEIAGNEGVYGLQRAFKIAGAKHLVMSLWQVPDYQTQELMTIFYQKMLLERMSVRVALQAAQEEMRQRNYEPYYWAGFVLIE